jgi:hypothetical protein
MTKNEIESLVEAIKKELDTRDKRFMFLKLEFPILVSRINLEGSAHECAWNIYFEFDKMGMTGSLMACMNTKFDLDLTLTV